uniref:Uncharacterized protein n=1 Tax=Anguilla anguilla TaxID=7936 RepID=A0A0E9S311_ANGAN
MMILRLCSTLRTRSSTYPASPCSKGVLNETDIFNMLRTDMSSFPFIYIC